MYKFKAKRDCLPVVVWLKRSLSTTSQFTCILNLQDVVVKIHNLLTVHYKYIIIATSHISKRRVKITKWSYNRRKQGRSTASIGGGGGVGLKMERP